MTQGTLFFAATGLPPATSYEFQVATNADFTGARSVTMSTENLLESTVSISLSRTDVLIRWRVSITNPTGKQVRIDFRVAGVNVWTPIQTLAAKTLIVGQTRGGLIAETTYEYRAVVLAAGGAGEVVSDTESIFLPPNAGPSQFTGTGADDRGITLTNATTNGFTINIHGPWAVDGDVAVVQIIRAGFDANGNLIYTPDLRTLSNRATPYNRVGAEYLVCCSLCDQRKSDFGGCHQNPRLGK